MNQNTDLKIPFFKPHLGNREIAALRRVIRRGWLTTGPEVIAFETEFQKFIDAESSTMQTLAVNSATAGLHLSMEALGVKPGDKVAVPSLTFTATAGILRYLGAHPVFIDSDAGTGNINLQQLRDIRKMVKGVIPVHLTGYPCNISEIRHALGDDRFIVEDAAHAFPCRTNAGMAGTLGDVGVYSFYATKTITTGEGGMIACRDADLTARMRLMRLHGLDRITWNRYHISAGVRSWEYDVTQPGFKYNMTDLAAAIGRIQLKKADALLKARHNQAHRYFDGLSDLPELVLPKKCNGHAWHLYIIKTQSEQIRDLLAQELHKKGIGTSMHFIPLHRMTYWKNRYSLHPQDFPVAEYWANHSLSIPIWPGLKRTQQNQIIKTIRNTLSG